MDEIYDNYQIIAPVGQGTYGHVYKAIEKETGKIVAIKKISNPSHFNTSMSTDVMSEIHSLETVSDDNIINLLSVVQNPKSNYIYLVFDYYPYDLRQITRFLHTLMMSQIKSFSLQITHGLAALHDANILHRDIKPANIFLGKDSHVYLGDFGLSFQINPEDNMPLSSKIATLWYRSPELLLGTTSYSFSVDVWSLGCVIYEMFTGMPLFMPFSQIEKSQFQKIVEICGPIPEATLKKWKRLPNFSSFFQANLQIQNFQNSGNISLLSYLNTKLPETSDMSLELKHELALAKDLLCRMLQYNPNDRISTAEMLSHPFLALNQTSFTSLPPLDLPESKNLRFEKSLKTDKERVFSPPVLKVPTPRILPPSILAD